MGNHAPISDFFFNGPATTEIYTFPTRRSSDLLTADLGRDVAAALGDRNALMLVNHGIVTVGPDVPTAVMRSEEHTSELQSRRELVCRLLLEKKNICCSDVGRVVVIKLLRYTIV